MPRIETVERTLFKFDELSDSAKENARNWWRDCQQDDEWWDYQYEDFETIAARLGVTLRQRAIPLMNGKTRQAPTIYFSGFSSRGDGACFEGTYSYSKGWRKKLKAHAPRDKELFAIGEALTEAQREVKWTGRAIIVHSGRYCHSRSMDITCDCDGGLDVSDGWASFVTQCMRDLADWLYKQLESEYEYRRRDEYIDECITGNDYEFLEDGTRA